MHIYYSNGICCVEIPLLVSMVEQVTSMSIQEIQHAVTSAGWKRPSGARRNAGENDYWRKTLFTPAYFNDKSIYKGDAKQARALMSLLRWLAQDVWIKHPDLHEVAACFCFSADVVIV